MSYVLTQKDNICNPVIYSNGFDVLSELDHAYSFEVLCSDNVNTVQVHVFNSNTLPHGFENQVQAVPLSVFMREVETQRGLMLLEPESK